ncbi:MAG TPA: 23S rRNA pseudouridine(1911/1915/1917) synthase RluD [Casimicrobiaceae bacterium]|nr:23S rRNA pseudouridine(1911/1915/1917) synthase RluD [Casimicrobiaceae bacterium]
MSRADYSRRSPHADAGAARADARSITQTVPADLAGMRLDQALARMLPEHSRTRLKAWIDAGQVTVDAAAWNARDRVAGGERIDVAAPAGDVALVDEPEDIALAVVFEDDALLVLNKPAGLVVHPGSGNRAGTLLNALLHHDPALASLPRAGIVHRLDKDTSGLMVVAKTTQAQTALVRELAAHRIAREYLAIARGDLARAVVVDAPIGRHPTQRTTMAVVARGKPARTHVDIVERFGIATQLRCTLETGRTHQIRVHLAAIGHPLVGDPAYGGRQARNVAQPMPAFARQALHAARLSLAHPIGGKTMTWNAAPPPDFAALVEALRRIGSQRPRTDRRQA